MSTSGEEHYTKISYRLSCSQQPRKHIPTTNLDIDDWRQTFQVIFASRMTYLICANTPQEVQLLLQKLNDESKNQGLTTNKSNTKVMMENKQHTNISDLQILSILQSTVQHRLNESPNWSVGIPLYVTFTDHNKLTSLVSSSNINIRRGVRHENTI